MTDLDAVETAKNQAEADKALLAALEARDKDKPVEQPKPKTLGDSFIGVVETIIYARRVSKIEIPQLVKLWELTLMWELNNRNNQRQQPNFGAYPDPIESGEETTDGEEIDLPVPNEVLGAEDAPNEE